MLSYTCISYLCSIWEQSESVGSANANGSTVPAARGTYIWDTLRTIDKSHRSALGSKSGVWCQNPATNCLNRGMAYRTTGRLHSHLSQQQILESYGHTRMSDSRIWHLKQLWMLSGWMKKRWLFKPLEPPVTICTTSLTFNNSTFCTHIVFMCFVWIWQ